MRRAPESPTCAAPSEDAVLMGKLGMVLMLRKRQVAARPSVRSRSEKPRLPSSIVRDVLDDSESQERDRGPNSETIPTVHSDVPSEVLR